MQVRVAKTAGFCFGVRRAVEMVAQEAAAGSGAVTLGPIIHNRHVVEEFAAQGVRPVETPGDAPFATQRTITKPTAKCSWVESTAQHRTPMPK